MVSIDSAPASEWIQQNTSIIIRLLMEVPANPIYVPPSDLLPLAKVLKIECRYYRAISTPIITNNT